LDIESSPESSILNSVNLNGSASEIILTDPVTSPVTNLMDIKKELEMIYSLAA